MFTREQILESLAVLQDPVYQQSLIELNLIRDIMVKESSVSLSYLASTEDNQVIEGMKQQITKILHGLHASDVHIRVRQMSDYDHTNVKKQQGNETKQHTHAVDLEDQSNILAKNSGVTFIAVASGKGGVGKSTATVNLAAALSRKGKRVGIIDADIYGFSIPDMMGIEEKPQMIDNHIVPAERFGIKVISMGFFVEDNAPIIWRGPMLGKMLRNFFGEVRWGKLDYMLLDLPPGTGDVALDVHQMIPQSKEIIVTTPHATAAFVAARAGAMAVHTNHEILGVIENMAYYVNKDGEKDYVFGRGGGAKLAEELHTEILAQIPLGAPDNHPSEPDFSPSVYKADTEIGQMYLEAAERIIEKTAK